jgi:glutathione S-transferase
MIQLYAFAPSGNAQKARIALRLLDLPFEEIRLSGGAHKRAPFTTLNPLGQVPVLVDGDLILRDSQAILVYLAAAYRPGDWDGHDPAERSRIAQWLSFAANEIANGPNKLRLAALFGVAIDRPTAEAITARVLDLIEAQLDGHDWLEGDRLTIADLACVPYLALASQGGTDVSHYPNIRGWCARIAGMAGFPTMDGWSSES